MLKVSIITQQLNEGQYWQETFSNAWSGQLELTLQKEFVIKKEADLIVLDFTGHEKAHETLTDISSMLTGKHFLIVSDVKDIDLAMDAMKFGAIGFLVKPFKRSELLATLERLRHVPAGGAAIQKSAKVIAMLSYKGGTGVSTGVVNLAYALSHVYQKKTLVIDAAGFSNHVTVLLNVIPKCTLADVCRQGEVDEQYLNSAVSNVGKNLSIIGGLIKPSDYNDVNIDVLNKLIEVASENYDFIIIDTSAHSLDEMTMFFINKATDLLLLTTFDLLAIRDNRFYIQTLKELGISEHKIKPIINRQNWYIGSLEPELVQKQINHNIFHALPNDWQLCVESSNYGRPVLELAPDSQLSTSYKILASKFVKSDSPETNLELPTKEAIQSEEKKQKKKGILGWF
jgi:pilus assembly protein CpaE